MGEIKRNVSGLLNNIENIRILGIWKWFSRSFVVSKEKKMNINVYIRILEKY